MEQNRMSCIRSVGGDKICSYCEGKLIKNGKTKQQKQRYKCKSCNLNAIKEHLSETDITNDFRRALFTIKTMIFIAIAQDNSCSSYLSN